MTHDPTGLATSDGGAGFRWHSTVFGTGPDGAWDRYQARLTCVLPTESGYLEMARPDGAHELRMRRVTIT